MHARVKSPDECNASELSAFAKLVRQGGQVSNAGLLDRIKAAKLLGLSYDDKHLVATAALKRPFRAHRRRVFDQAGVAEQASQFPYELGWAFTLPEFRGEGRCLELIHILLDASPKANIFATTATDNLAMQVVLGKCDFERRGHRFPGRIPGATLQMWTHGVPVPNVIGVSKL